LPEGRWLVRVFEHSGWHTGQVDETRVGTMLGEQLGRHLSCVQLGFNRHQAKSVGKPSISRPRSPRSNVTGVRTWILPQRIYILLRPRINQAAISQTSAIVPGPVRRCKMLWRIPANGFLRSLQCVELVLHRLDVVEICGHLVELCWCSRIPSSFSVSLLGDGKDGAWRVSGLCVEVVAGSVMRWMLQLATASH
jgi:hypothetical protein